MAATVRAPTCSATAVVAVDAATGKYLWHFQAMHHDIWDYDLDTPPVLLEVKKDGKTIPAIAAMNKDALLYILNRVTGEPIFRVTETPVPDSRPSPARPPGRPSRSPTSRRNWPVPAFRWMKWRT